MLKFSEEEIKEIDEKLRQARELQLRNGNRMYSTEEVLEAVNKVLKGEYKYIRN